MAAQEENFCLTKVLPSEFKANRFGAREYKLDVKPLVINNAKIEFRQRRLPLDVDDVAYTHYATISWDRAEDMKSYNICKQLEKEAATLIANKKIHNLATNTDLTLGSTTILGYGFVHAVSCHPGVRGLFFIECKVEIIFPSIDVFSDGSARINPVLKKFVLGKLNPGYTG